MHNISIIIICANGSLLGKMCFVALSDNAIVKYKLFVSPRQVNLCTIMLEGKF